jgi:hypothetical protein
VTDEIPRSLIREPQLPVVTPQEAWLDLIQLADESGVIDILSFTERWGWERDQVQQFFRKLEAKDHIRAYDASRWCIMFQLQEDSFVLEYEHIWRIYPKRVAKRKGLHAYAATRKGRPKEKEPIVSARILYLATKAYAKSRDGEDPQYTLNPDTFFGPDYRWREKPRTNNQTKGSQKWSRPTSRDLTRTPGAQTKGRSLSTKKTPPKKKSGPPRSPRKKTPRKDDPLGSL